MSFTGISKLTARRVAVFGGGAEGRSVWEAIRRWGGRTPRVFLDEPPAPGTVPEDLDRVIGGEGSDMAAALDGVDLLVRSPGIRLGHPLLVEAARRGIEVTTNVNLFLSEVRAAGLPVIGITGSKGKSTTSTLTYRVLREAGRAAGPAGAHWRHGAGVWCG